MVKQILFHEVYHRSSYHWLELPFIHHKLTYGHTQYLTVSTNIHNGKFLTKHYQISIHCYLVVSLWLAVLQSNLWLLLYACYRNYKHYTRIFSMLLRTECKVLRNKEDRYIMNHITSQKFFEILILCPTKTALVLMGPYLSLVTLIPCLLYRIIFHVRRKWQTRQYWYIYLSDSMSGVPKCYLNSYIVRWF